MKKYCRLRRNLSKVYEVLQISATPVISKEYYGDPIKVFTLFVVASVDEGEVEAVNEYDVLMIPDVQDLSTHSRERFLSPESRAHREIPQEGA